MGKKTDYWTHPQNRRAACLAMAIRHVDAVGYTYEAEDVIEHAAMFGDYIMTGEVPAMDETDTDDGASEPVIGLNAGLGTLDNEPLLDMKVTQAATKPTESVQDKATADPAYDIESEKRKIEVALATAAKCGLNVKRIDVKDGQLAADWSVPFQVSPFKAFASEVACDAITCGLQEIYRHGQICSIRYDRCGFPCVSWSPAVGAAA
ncbi:hypothetical protein Geu3261_0025_007 [Komagataeibacter europaeus NBRC 3261]|uniref:Uncharacterized protein n=1 Tax=Komagataeibacter europaeus NBRC 3261 TaxID=1234669 RepID=A0A0D6PY61_KOMEU|nr:hypothetical protein [Komagataeibacter europaeus]GAN95451.1 hypothetical protein Geu3261_0025_007 [Komagataeibacter europaeus NBRC 3261]